MLARRRSAGRLRYALSSRTCADAHHIRLAAMSRGPAGDACAGLAAALRWPPAELLLPPQPGGGRGRGQVRGRRRRAGGRRGRAAARGPARCTPTWPYADRVPGAEARPVPAGRRARRRTRSSSPSTAAGFAQRRQGGRTDHAGPGGARGAATRWPASTTGSAGRRRSRRPSTTSRPPSAGCAPTPATYGLDPTRIAAWGHSAGGTLAALAGTSGGVAALTDPEPAATPDQPDTAPGRRRLVRPDLLPAQVDRGLSRQAGAGRSDAHSGRRSFPLALPRRGPDRRCAVRVRAADPDHVHHRRRSARRSSSTAPPTAPSPCSQSKRFASGAGPCCSAPTR